VLKLRSDKAQTVRGRLLGSEFRRLPVPLSEDWIVPNIICAICGHFSVVAFHTAHDAHFPTWILGHGSWCSFDIVFIDLRNAAAGSGSVWRKVSRAQLNDKICRDGKERHATAVPR